MVLGTSIALATVSPWYLIPYLLLIGWMLFGPPGGGPPVEEEPRRRFDQPAPPIQERPAARGTFWSRLARRRVEVVEAAKAEEPPEPERAEDAAPSETTSSNEPLPGRRSKVKRRVKLARIAPETNPASPVEIVWERVGPNQFVRKEVAVEPSPSAEESPSIVEDGPARSDSEDEPGRVEDGTQSDSEPDADEVDEARPTDD